MSKEFLLAGIVMANPLLAKKVPRRIIQSLHPVAREIIIAIKDYGETYATPTGMTAYLQSLDMTLKKEDIDNVFLLIPDYEEATVDKVLNLTRDVEKDFVECKFKQDLSLSLSLLTQGGIDPRNLLPEIKTTIETYLTGMMPKDNTLTGIFDRMVTAPPLPRFRSGIDQLDILFSGDNNKGVYDCGLVGVSEVIAIAAGYKTGKTRLLYNILGTLLNQAASVAMFCLEDSDQKYTKKLMCANFDIGLQEMNRFISTQGDIDPKFLTTFDESGEVIYQRCVDAITWAKKHAANLRIYDSTDGIGFGMAKFKHLQNLIQNDILRYGTKVIIIDYIGKMAHSYEDLTTISAELATMAVAYQVAIIEIHQLANETIKNGPDRGVFAAKGSGQFGADAHIGIMLNADIYKYGREVRMDMVIAREAAPCTLYYTVNPFSGHIPRFYETPEHGWPLVETYKKGK